LSQFLETHDLEIFVEASYNPNWDATINEEYCSLMVNDTWDLIPLTKGRELSYVNGCVGLSMQQMDVLIDIRPN